MERLVEESGPGWTVLRATRFHDLVLTVLRGVARLPVLLLPARVKDQPADVTEVADRLAEPARGAPAGRVDDMGGPEVRTSDSLARAYLKATGRRRAVAKVPLGGAAYGAFRAGGHLAPGRAVGKGTSDEYLTKRFGAGVAHR